MKQSLATLLFGSLCVGAPLFGAPSLTIYNGGYAVARDTLSLALEQGGNRVDYSQATARLEPESVILRPLAEDWPLAVLEQNYRADPVSQGLLLSLFEGETIAFERRFGEALRRVEGKIVRSGYEPGGGMRSKPIIEVDGELRFGLPGLPLFPSLGDGSILRPTLEWTLQSGRTGELEAEIAYLTQGLSWHADYNLVAAGEGDEVAVVGWITMDNQSGKTFKEAKVKLMAGDVRKLAPRETRRDDGDMEIFSMARMAAPEVEQKAFEDFHLYELPRLTTLRDRQTKQVEFLRAEGVRAKRIYLYDGSSRFVSRGGRRGSPNTGEAFGTEGNAEVWILREIENTEENALGKPLPKGRARFYRRDADDGQLEFTGESEIDHTPRNELVRLYTGNAFDIVGERKRTDYRYDSIRHTIDETFEIEIRNRKEESATVRVVEHLYRWSTWEIESSSLDYEKVDSDTIAFEVEAGPDSVETVSYRVHYWW